MTFGVSKTLSFISSAKRPVETSVDRVSHAYFNAVFEIVQYKLEFDSTREMFRYIKKSGVSGSRNVLDYKETKKLMKEYPLNYLEFEVAFIRSH